MNDKRTIEKAIAVGCFLAAVGLSFTSVVINEDHDITAGVLMMCAQFLTLCATIIGVDYKFTEVRRRTQDEK